MNPRAKFSELPATHRALIVLGLLLAFGGFFAFEITKGSILPLAISVLGALVVFVAFFHAMFTAP